MKSPFKKSEGTFFYGFQDMTTYNDALCKPDMYTIYIQN